MAGYGQLRLALAVLRKRSVPGCLENQGDERELLAADHSSHPPAPLGRKGDSTRLEAFHPVARGMNAVSGGALASSLWPVIASFPRTPRYHGHFIPTEPSAAT